MILHLSAAFHTVARGVLIDVLQRRFAVYGNAFEWFRSYNAGRNLRFRTVNDCSGPVALTCSVIEGSDKM